ncbi:MAG TPA: hypothetical protein VFO07_06225, partial [Roseiflexaceae bacterium]|nr:hypothetical protein [Roseiflexaceae bacterium]
MKGELMMIQAAWLGYYWTGNDDPFDDPAHRLHLFVSSSDRLCFEYYYESRSNHGYDIEFHEGTVRSASEGELVIDVAYRYETS